MTALRRFLAGAVAGASMLVAIAATPASATPVREAHAEAMECILEPGVYLIMNSKDEFVGVLIMYPDCRTEIIPAT
jgi:hypothetical protein